MNVTIQGRYWQGKGDASLRGKLARDQAGTTWIRLRSNDDLGRDGKLIEHVRDTVDKLRNSLARDRGDGECLATKFVLDSFSGFGGAGHVELCHNQQLGAIGESGTIKFKFLADRAIVGDRVGTVKRDRVDQVDQHARTLDMPEEFVTEAVPFVRAFDQAGNIGDHERPIGSG